MARHWTFGRRLGAALGGVVALSLIIGLVGIFALRAVTASKDQVITLDAALLAEAERLRSSFDRAVAAARAFLLIEDESALAGMRDARSEFRQVVDGLQERLPAAEGREELAAILSDEADYFAIVDRAITMRRSGTDLEEVSRVIEEQGQPRRQDLDQDIAALVARLDGRLASAIAESTATASRAITITLVLTLAALLFAATMAVLLSRLIGRQVGSAVAAVRSSSAELQATANQQATGASEQASAMAEISTTIGELLASSRQIAESARRVAHVAEQTAGAAKGGDQMLAAARESITGIQSQVEQIVRHMLELGTKSRQIGGVVEIVSELAEQTNILSVNATIEAAGAGEAGRRFAVVAEEIRKLADRVAGSAKEIRGLMEDVSSSVHTTVMATEIGSKAVEAGTRHFGEMATAFQQIAGLVVTTSEAAREIELSTKQQASAVEQVNVAIHNAAQATRETEASSGQTLQTASELTALSSDLLRLVQPQSVA